MSQRPGDTVRWWQAYLLAEHELRTRAEQGDRQARYHLAHLMIDQGQPEQAAATIRPLADEGDADAGRLMERWLSYSEHIDRLRGRASGGGLWGLSRELANRMLYGECVGGVRADPGLEGEAARRELIADTIKRGLLAELRQRAVSGDGSARRWLVALKLHETQLPR